MTANINNVNLLITQSYAQRRNIDDRIEIKKKQLTATESLLANKEQEIAITKQLIDAKKQIVGNNNKQIDATTQLIEAKKEVIVNNEKRIEVLQESVGLTKALIANNEARIFNNTKTINILQDLKTAHEELTEMHKGRLGLLQESRDLTKESRDLTKESRDLMQQMIVAMEKMLAIMEKNPAKYGGLSNTEIQKKPEVIEAKDQVTQLANSKIKEYPLNMRPVLKEITKKVVDAPFSEINPNNIKANRDLFSNLGNRIEATLDKKYETLSVKDFNKLIDTNYKSVENFFRIKKLDYLDLALKDIKA